jgi:N-dimethylarginine dimethylaminohydrolase
MTDRPRFLVCAPEHFEVSYSINPWMDPARGADRSAAFEQWAALRTVLSEHADVMEIDAREQLPDMCFAANGGFVHGCRFVASRFLHPQRRGEEARYLHWFEDRDFDCIRSKCCRSHFPIPASTIWIPRSARSPPAACCIFPVPSMRLPTG